MIDNYIPYLAVALFVIANAIIFYSFKTPSDNDTYFIGGRNADWRYIALSVAATGFWANSVFFITKFSNIGGIASSIIFAFSMVIPVVLMSIAGYYVAAHSDYKKFYNMDDYVSVKTGSKQLGGIFAFIYALATIYTLTSNVTALGVIAEFFPSMNYTIATALIIGTTCVYTMMGGFKATVRTDILQLVFLLTGGLVTGLLVTNNMSSLSEVIQQVNQTKPFAFFTTTNIRDIFLTLLIIISSSALCDNGLYQRVFALGNRKNVLKAFGVGCTLYLIAVLGFGILAWAAMAGGVKSQDIYGLMENIQNNGGAILLVMFITGLLSVSASTMDSSLHSVGSIIASKFKNEKIQRTVAKISIVSFCVIAYALVQLKIDLWILLVTFGAVRLSLVVPTVYIIVNKIDLEWKVIAGSIALSLLTNVFLQTQDISKFYVIAMSAAAPLLVLIPYKVYRIQSRK